MCSLKMIPTETDTAEAKAELSQMQRKHPTSICPDMEQAGAEIPNEIEYYNAPRLKAVHTAA
ncbi:MAG: hypothetical protein ACLVEJ_24930 [Parabacteroides sp.]